MQCRELTDEQLHHEIDRATELELQHSKAERSAHARLVRVGLTALLNEVDRRRELAS